MTHYIYCITNKTNNKSYVGQTDDLKERWSNHHYDAKRVPNPEKKYNRKFAFQNALAKYGVDGFNWKIIDEFETLDEANDEEEFYIAYLGTLAPNGYNLHRGGRNKKPSEATKKKISEKLKMVGSFVGKKGKDHPNFGTKQSEERKKATSLRLSGDGCPTKKINGIIAREIYERYLKGGITIVELVKGYGLAKNTIRNILNKKSWKEVLADLPPITFYASGAPRKISDADMEEMILLYASGKYTQKEIGDMYNIDGALANLIINRKYKRQLKL